MLSEVDKGLFASSIQGIKLFLAEPDRRTNHVLIKMLHPGSSRNRQHGARAFEEPGERHLTGLGVVSLGDRVEGAPGASQFSKRQGGPGDKADTLALTQIYHRLGLGNRHLFGLAHRQIIVILHCDNRDDLLGSCQLIDRDIRQSDMANLPSYFLLSSSEMVDKPANSSMNWIMREKSASLPCAMAAVDICWAAAVAGMDTDRS